MALDTTSEGLYRATFEACQKVTEQDLKGTNADKLRAGYFPSQELTDIHNFIRSESARDAVLSLNFFNSIPTTQNIIRDKGFRRALQECYAESPQLKTFFVNSILASDRAGKISGAVAVGLLFKGTGKIFSLFDRWGRAAAKALEFSFLASTLTADVEIKQKGAADLAEFSTSNLQASLAEEMAKVSSLEKSLREQILQEETKLKNCAGCPEIEFIKANRAALENILKAMNL